MENQNQLFLILTGDEFRNCLYRLRDADINEDDETSIGTLEPLLKMDKSTFPERMTFTSIGSRIYMIGGRLYNNDGHGAHPVTTTFIYDTLSNSVLPGPTLNSGKSHPILLTLGSKLFALSRILSVGAHLLSVIMRPEPHFEVLDTDNLERGWRVLPVPQLRVSNLSNVHGADVVAYAATYVDDRGVIFISLGGMGTYAFDVEEEAWHYVSDEKLPFKGHAHSMPPSPDLPYVRSLCFAHSSKTRKYSVFRFRYCATKDGHRDREFQVDEVETDTSPFPSFLLSLPPPLYHVRSVMAFGPGGRVYYVAPGADNPGAWNTYIGNCYVKVLALEVSARKEHGMTLKVDSNEGQLLKRRKKKKRRHLDVGNDEAPDECVKLDLNKGSSLKRCRNTKMELENDEEKDKETMELKLTSIWRRSFFAGPICDMMFPVSAAIAM